MQDLKRLRAFHAAVVEGYRDDQPLHVRSYTKPGEKQVESEGSEEGPAEEEESGEKDERSCLVHLTYEAMRKLSTREIQEIFRRHHIVVTGCPHKDMEFDREGLQTLEKRMNSIISAQGTTYLACVFLLSVLRLSYRSIDSCRKRGLQRARD